MKKSIGIMIAKKDSKRLSKKNKKMICGRKMFHWNLMKLVNLFEEVYISSDDAIILEEADRIGAHPIKRPKRLQEHEVPSVPIFQHIVQSIDYKPENIVNVQANSPTCPLKVIEMSARAIGCTSSRELLTVYPESHEINGSVWAFSYDKLMDYGDYRTYKPDILVADKSIDIHYEEDLEIARDKFEKPSFAKNDSEEGG